MKRLVITPLLFFGISFGGQLLDKIVVVVGDKPITVYEIEQVARQLQTTRQRAFNILVDRRLVDYELERKGIQIDQFQIDKKLEEVAHQNGMDKEHFIQLLKSRGEYHQFISQLTDELKRDKLFKQITIGRVSINDLEAKQFYEAHKQEWQIWQLAQVTAYYAPTPDPLKAIIQSPLNLSSGVEIKKETLFSVELPIPVAMIIKKTPVGGHTPIIPTDKGYAVYYIDKKEGKGTLPFKKVKNLIYNIIYQQKRREVLKSYFDKLKNSKLVQPVDYKLNVGD